MKLRRPWEKLAGCMWLPRFADKVRHEAAGTLHPDFVQPFGHPLATDGAFFAHFELTKEEAVAAIRAAADDAAVAAWFLARPHGTPERIAAWNELAPHLGREGYPMRRGFRWAMQHYYGGAAADPRVDSVFTAIAFDEGYLDEWA